ncbi:hypothetical protein AYK24_03305 [Thermoplasmatales archaeon SG8-52-4]|nr:MAG: hypothetical protein AYK24_03305 [Thermoplasmatales archaeon SG8-52-4]
MNGTKNQIIKISLIGPGSECIGGVSTYIDHVRTYSKYKTVFIRLPSVCYKGIIYKCSLLLVSYFKFIWILITNHINLVHINPSLTKNAVLRDSFFAFLSFLFSKKILIQWHGWNPDNEYLLSKYKNILRASLWKASQINVLTPSLARKLRLAGYKNEIGYTKTFVDDKFIKKASNDIKCSIGTILFLSTISKNKGIYEAIETFRLIRIKYPDFRFIVAGDGPELDIVKNSLDPEIREKITFTGYVTGIHKEQVFNESDLYLFPSHYEGMPISLLEAMGYGLPVICSKVGAIPDFFEEEKMGFMVNGFDPVDYANRIEYLISNKERVKSISKYNSQYIRENHLASNHIIILDKIYNSIANDKND